MNQTEIDNCNNIMKLAGKMIYNNIFTLDQLAVFACASLSVVNETPPFSAYTLNDTEFIKGNLLCLSEYTAMLANTCREMIERGRVFEGDGLVFKPPNTSDIIAKYPMALESWMARVKKVKLGS